jgi:hypothetical protein
MLVRSDSPGADYIAAGALEYAAIVGRYIAAGIGITGADFAARGAESAALLDSAARGK